jgi:hypothetical protein
MPRGTSSAWTITPARSCSPFYRGALLGVSFFDDYTTADKATFTAR